VVLRYMMQWIVVDTGRGILFFASIAIYADGDMCTWVKVKCSRNSVFDVCLHVCCTHHWYQWGLGLRFIRMASRAHNNSASANSSRSAICTGFLGVEDVWKYFTLHVRCPFVVTHTFKAPMSSVFHHQSLVHTTLVKSCSCSSSQGVVCFVATDSCCFAEMSNSFAESVMSEWFVGIPAGWCESNTWGRRSILGNGLIDNNVRVHCRCMEIRTIPSLSLCTDTLILIQL